jgi:eukaryotic-like serine/threonine-protein kinase
MHSSVQPGSEIDGFTVGDRIHAGGMAEIFRVSKPGFERPLIMKAPRLGAEASESLVAFETEAMIAPTLTGSHVAPFVAASELTRTPYLVFEWTEGQTLEEKLAAGPLPPVEVAAIGAALADALYSVHQQRVVHLDVKPSNVILRGDGSVVLIDFGYAHHERLPDLLAEETRFRAGSAPYVSPEQLLGRRNDRRSDLFALGVVLYELASGKLPFGEPDADVRNRFWLDPTPPATLVPDFPPWLQEAILRCLEPRAELRYQSAAHVAFDLRHPEQIALTPRSKKSSRAGLVAHARRFLRAHAEHAARLRSPPPLPSRTPIVLVAVNTARMEDERHPAIRFAISQMLALSTEFRLICLTVIPASASSLEHLVQLRRWVEPLGLPAPRLSLHAVASEDPAGVIVEIARYNNVDVLVVGAPSEGGRAWSQSTASTVTANANSSVHVVRVRKR